VSSGVQQFPHRSGQLHRRLLSLLAGLIVVAVAAVIVDQVAFSDRAAASSRPVLQEILDELVAGPGKIAPGVTAYVSGPNGTWMGSAGAANVKTHEQMRPDARMRLDSISKWWLATVILQLDQEHKLTLDDTVAHWLPGLLPYGNRITIRELLTDTSGMIDDNDITPTSGPHLLAHVKDATLRKQLTAVAAKITADPNAKVSAMWLIRLVAWQPLLFTPGTQYHHCNTGWDILGLIAARVEGKPLPTIYQERLFQPLHLKETAYDPQGAISGPHAHGYQLHANGSATDTSAQAYFKAADGAIASTAPETAKFFTALFGGKLINHSELATLQRDKLVDGGGGDSGCAGHDHVGSGLGNAYRSRLLVKDDGSRIAVLLLNGGYNGEASVDDVAGRAIITLYCNA
jgi:D-alanyl-D-alanine carboxypeptidase